MLQRFGLLSDIHGNILALQAIVADMQFRNVDQVINLGDHLSGPLWPVETADFLMQQDWVQIRGNHERRLLEQDPAEHNLSDHYTYECLSKQHFQWLRELPDTAAIEDEVLAVHGAPGDDLCYLLESIAGGRTHLSSMDEIREKLHGEKTPVVLCGHTHKQRVVAVEEMLIVNPGSVGLQAYEDDTPEYHVSEAGSPHARYAIMEKISNQWQVELICVNYDVEQAVLQAQKNERPDWTVALRTGYSRK
jgi:putative phosphoesterase